jgi:hypothetical protein
MDNWRFCDKIGAKANAGKRGAAVETVEQTTTTAPAEGDTTTAPAEGDTTTAPPAGDQTAATTVEPVPTDPPPTVTVVVLPSGDTLHVRYEIDMGQMFIVVALIFAAVAILAGRLYDRIRGVF